MVGYFITFVTIIWSFKALAYGEWDASNPSAHVVLGLIVLTLIFIVTLSAVSSIMLSKLYHGTPDWYNKTEPQNRIGKFHKFAGYFIILCGIAASASGIISF